MAFHITCPHCLCFVQIEAVACGIFRHAALKSSGEQINPHTPKEECERLVREDLVQGCAMPFRVVQVEGEWTAVKCDFV